MHHFTRQSASFHPVKYGRLRDTRSYLIFRLIINKATLTIGSPRNSVRVVLLIARGWRAKAKATLGHLPRVVTTLQALYLLFLGILSRHSKQKTYNTYGVDLLTTYITQGRLTPTLGCQRYNAFSVELKRYYKQRHFTRQSASNGRAFCRILHDEMTQTILCFIINIIVTTIISFRNSVRVVLLIARGWRGTSLPRVNIRKEIQRHRC